jgi:hypothetical protein
VGLVDGGLELTFGQARDNGDEGFGFGHGVVSYGVMRVVLYTISAGNKMR